MDRNCKKCDSKLLHYEIYDGYCCLLCNTWSGERCDESNGCSYCNKRPEIPFTTDYHNSILVDIIANGFHVTYESVEEELNN